MSVEIMFPGVRIGVDAYSLRSQHWTAFEILDYCAQRDAMVVHFSEVRLLGGLDRAHLKAVQAHAAERGLEVEIGMLSMCSFSNLFDPSQGTAEEQLSRMIAAARTIGSPIVRAVVGNAKDRRSPVPFVDILKEAVRVLHNVRSCALGEGIKIAIENHSGDMQAWELRQLIEEAGPDCVGACFDSGNPLITLEDPHLSLEILAPHVLTSHIRDSAVWVTPEGASVAWVRMGEGNVGIDQLIRRYVELCPGRAVSIESVVSPQPKRFPIHLDDFWAAYREVPAWQFARFLRIASGGTAPAFADPSEDPVRREREDFEASFDYLKHLLEAANRFQHRTAS
jgi:3-oxoisoapionate decarboxylase